MKSLNKTLSLVLALCLVFSLMGVAGAADFKDDADIQYKEAVDVMTGIGAINGMDNGSFEPTATVTRAQAAKMVAYAVLGADVAKNLPAAATQFTDVDATAYSWATGSINYLTAKGIINGTSATTFDPNGKVTAYQLGKMLLCAAGYGVNDEFVGSNWAINVAVAANNTGIFKGTKAADFNAPATREEAALYCFNGITKVPTVSYSKLSGRYEMIANKGTENFTNDDYFQIAEKVYSTLKKNASDSDDFGRVASVWTYGTANKKIAKLADEAAYTIVVNDPTKTDFAKLVAGANRKLVIDATASAAAATDFTTVYLNGDSQTSVAPTAPFAVTNSYASDVQVGDIIELYVSDTDANAVTNIVVTRYALSKINVVPAAPGTKDTNGDAVSCKIHNAGGKTFTAAYNTEFPGFNADTYVKNAMIAVATKADHTVIASFIPEYVTGAIKAITSSTVKIDAKTYPMVGADFSNPESIAAANIDWKTGVYGVYADKNGCALGMKTETASVALTDVYYVNAIYTENSSSFGTKATKAYAQVVALDGTVKVLEVGFDAGEVLANTVDFTLTPYYSKSGNEYTLETTGKADGSAKYYKIAAEVGHFYTFKLNNTTNINVPTEFVTSTAYDVATAATQTNDLKTTSRKTDVGTYLTSDTKYIVIEKDGAKAKTSVITGGVSNDKANPIAVIAKEDLTKNLVAEYVVVDLAGEYAGTENDTDVLYVPEASSTYVGATNYAVEAYNMNGEKVTITADSTAANNTFYTYTTDADGVYTLKAVTTARADQVKVDGTKMWDTTKVDTDNVFVGALYGELFAGIHNTDVNFTTNDKATTPAKLVTDIPAASAKVIDTRDITANGQYGAEITSLYDLATASSTIKTGTTKYAVTVDTYVSNEGVVVIFVTDAQ